jgi:acetate kinase
MAARRVSILTLNVGSSSLKFGVYVPHGDEVELALEGGVDMSGNGGSIRYRNEHDGPFTSHPWNAQASPMRALLKLPPFAALGQPDIVAHRVVHGGPWLRKHCIIDGQVVEKIEAAASFAPLHVPAALSWIRHAREGLPNATQVACFDTAFHYPLPDLARILPLPHGLQEHGVERFGFHGLSCESIVRQLGSSLPSRVVVAHLGSGASLTAIQDGRSIDTTMGMTPTGGIIMATRPGDLDPGVLLFLLRQGHVDADGLEDMLEHRSGLRGISDLSGDARELAAADGKPLAELALAQFAQSVARQAAGLAVVLGGLDLLVFTGGIGENDNSTRERVIAHLRPCFPAFLTRVIPAQENRMMAVHARRLADPTMAGS